MIQTVKLSLFEVIVYHSFPVAPFTEVTFLARESFVIQNDQNAPASWCLLSLKGHCRQVSGWFYLTEFRDSNGKIILPYKKRTGKKIFHVRRISQVVRTDEC